MYMDVLKLRNWYTTHRGRVVRRILQNYIRSIWPDVSGKKVLVIGYALPYLHNWQLQDDVNIMCVMPARMGVVHWPDDGPNKTMLAWEDNLPFVDNEFDHVLVMHGLEFCDHSEELLAESWRVLKPDGRILVMTPNRTGPWSRVDRTPFGRGQPYSSFQLTKLLRDEDFMVLDTDYALFVPPSERKWVLSLSRTFENIGHRWWPFVGGVVMVEGRKDMYGGHVVRISDKIRKSKDALNPARVIPTTLQKS